jgi:hypothetical protein
MQINILDNNKASRFFVFLGIGNTTSGLLSLKNVGETLLLSTVMEGNRTCFRSCKLCKIAPAVIAVLYG